MSNLKKFPGISDPYSPAQFNLEVSGYYRCSNGMMAYIGYVVPGDTYYLIGNIFPECGPLCAMKWDLHGYVYGADPDFDIVGDWEDD